MICCMLMVMLMITLIPAQTANAAAKSYKAVEVTTSYAYCQGMYFWMEFVDDCDGMYPRLWCSHDKTGKGEVLLADSKLTLSPLPCFSHAFRLPGFSFKSV